MIKLIDLLFEAKQVGILYHYTPLKNIPKILGNNFLNPNEQGQISTTRYSNIDVLQFIERKTNVARLMLDGDKISTRYKIRPFVDIHSDLKSKIEFEEQIIVNKNPFYFLPYLKRIDLFITNPKDTNILKIEQLLQTANIPYKTYNESNIKSIVYKQSKEGNPEDIDIEKIPKKEQYTLNQMYYPGMKVKEIEVYFGESSLKYGFPMKIEVGISSEYPNYYLYANIDMWDEELYNVKGEKIKNIKTVPIPMYKDPTWRKKWKLVLPPNNFFDEKHTFNTYILIPKNEV